MYEEVAKEIFSLLNLACSGVFLLILIVYVLWFRKRRAVLTFALPLAVLLCLLNSRTLYFFL